MPLTLTQTESTLLAEILSFCRSELSLDIAGTDAKALREELKEREALLDKLLSQLQERQSGSA